MQPLSSREAFLARETWHCFGHVLKGVVGRILCLNEAEVQIHMEIDHHISKHFTRQNQTDLLVLWVRSGSQCPFDMLHLPNSGRGSQQLLLSRTDIYP